MHAILVIGPAGLAARLGRRWLEVLSPRNLCLLSGVVALIYVAATVVSYSRALDTQQVLTDSGFIGGDYSAFYAAGRLVLQGQVRHLFDAPVVREIQQSAIDGPNPDFYVAFRNPPFFAMLFAPLAGLDLIPSFAIWTVVSLALVILATALALETLPRLLPHWKLVAVAIAGFCPVFAGLVDGQNASLSLLLYVLVYIALRQGHEGRAGAWAALGLFKPQLFFILPLVFAAGRRWRALAVYGCVASVLALASLALVGIDGAIAWARIIVGFEPANAAKLAGRMYSLKAFFDVLLPGQSITSLVLSILCSVVVLGLLARAWRVHGSLHRDLPLLWVLTMLGAVLVDPHLLDYDLTVLILPALLIVGMLPEASWWMVGMFVVTAIDAPLIVGPVNLQLGVVLVAALAARVWWRLERRRPRVRVLTRSIERPRMLLDGGARAA